jgi:uncharacterized protein (TIGR02145 family)
MKKLFTFTVALIIAATLIGQAPSSFKYQAVLRDARGNIKANTATNIIIDILQGSATGTAVYSETHSVTTDGYGLINLELGNGTATTGAMSAINWGTGIYFVKVTVDGVVMGTGQLLSVPYALHAKTVASYTETDPVFVVHPANGISGANITNWNNAYGWGNHASAGYVPNTRTITINGTALDFASNRSWNVGTVTFVELSLPNIFSLSGSPITTSGTLTASLASQTANTIFASPNGSGGVPSFRALVATDIPNLDWNKITTGKPTTLSGYGITDAVNTTGDQTIAGNKSFTGTTTVPTPVNATDAATKAYVDALIEQLYAQGALRVRDYEGNYYNTIKIGDQIWMAENLKTTKYRNGDLIGTTTPATLDITSESTPKYQWAYDGNESNVATYGRLYTWNAVTDSRNVCPTGWHIPTDAEWTTLTTYLGGESVAGGKLKETGTSHWQSPNTGATNETGFTALPSGERDYDGAFHGIGYHGSWWSATEGNASDAWNRYVHYDDSDVIRFGINKKNGFFVRCLRDF